MYLASASANAQYLLNFQLLQALHFNNLILEKKIKYSKIIWQDSISIFQKWHVFQLAKTGEPGEVPDILFCRILTTNYKNKLFPLQAEKETLFIITIWRLVSLELQLEVKLIFGIHH